MTIHNGVSRQCRLGFMLLWAWILLLCVPELVAAGEISGTITNENGDALSGVPVVLSSVDTSYVDGQFTDSDGYFIITDIPNGRYTVTPQGYGHTFHPYAVSINVNGNTIVMDFPAGPDTYNFANFDASSVDFVGGTYSCSTPAYDAVNYAFWTDPEIQGESNCYNYALNVLDDASIGGGASPGIAGGYDMAGASTIYGDDPCRIFTEGAITDGLEYIGNGTFCSDGKTLVALFTNYFAGFHWCRRDSNGQWSNKNGTGVPRWGLSWMYPTHCANFCVCSSSVNGQGHEIIAGPDWF